MRRLPREAWACRHEGHSVEVIGVIPSDCMIDFDKALCWCAECGQIVLYVSVLTGPARELAEALLAAVRR